MSSDSEIRVPDSGDFTDVPVIEIHVAAGDEVAVEDPLVTLESDKATMDVPAPSVDDSSVSSTLPSDTRSPIETASCLTTPANGAGPSERAAPDQAAPARSEPEAAPPRPPGPPPGDGGGDHDAQVLVIGSGPGGYTAAFRAADLGRRVVLVDREPTLGGVCLNVGCIPSKALLHAARVIAETKEMSENGISFGPPTIDLGQLRAWKEGVVGRLTGGLAGLAKQRKVTTIRGYGRFTSPNELRVELAEGGEVSVGFEHAIIAAGSEAVTLPFIPAADPRVMDSTGALEIGEVPERLLVIGGGIIGLEMATVYHELGARITVVELLDQLIPGVDRDVVAPLAKRVSRQYENVFLRTRVTAVQSRPEGLVVSFASDSDRAKAPATDTFDRILVAVGRRPNGALIGAERAGITVDPVGFIPVSKQLRTSVPHIFAIGDIVGQPMLAHKAMHEAKVAAEVIAGKNSYFDVRAIPSVAYTDPEVAWAGVTENEAKAAGVAYGKGVFPWAASGRSLTLGRSEGMTKVLFDEATGRIIGCGIVGPSAGDLISEAVLAIEMGAVARDVLESIHPHPTLTETVMEAAELAYGAATHVGRPRATAKG